MEQEASIIIGEKIRLSEKKTKTSGKDEVNERQMC